MGFFDRFVLPFVPAQLCSIDKKLKAPPFIIGFLTFLAYFVGIAVFVALYVTQSKSYSTETTIQTSDISNSEWTCSMASIVTRSVTVDEKSDPIVYYDLFNINELKSDCLSALQGTSPCSNQSSMLFTPGSATYDYFLEVVATSSNFNGSTSSFFFLAKTLDLEYQTYFYDVDSAHIETGKIGTHFEYSYPFGVDFIGGSVGLLDNRGVYITAGDTGKSAEITSFEDYFIFQYCFDDSCLGSVLANDNFGRLYVTMSKGSNTSSKGTAVNEVYLVQGDDHFIESNVTYLTSIDTSGGAIVSFAVFSPGKDVPINQRFFYFLQSTSEALEFQLCLSHNGSSVVLVPNISATYAVIQLSAYDNRVYYYSALNLYSVGPDGDSTFVESMPRAYHFQLIANDTQVISTEYQTLVKRSLVNPKTTNEILMGFTDSIAGWYTCGNELGNELPENIDSSTSCSQNGISWQLQYQNVYYATEEDFSAMATSNAYALCNATLYETICETVGNLPPYICSRKQYLPFFTVFATAIANAHLLTVILFVSFGLLLSRSKQDDRTKSVGTGNIEFNPM